MDRGSSVSREQGLVIPAGIDDLKAFRRWALSEEFPERGRIDFLAGSVEAELSPEDLQTHGAVKAAIAAELHALIVGQRRGQLFIDKARVSSEKADLSAEPDVVAVLWESLETGRARYDPRARGGPERCAEIEGGPDLVVEIVSDSSVRKDTVRLPRLYALAGVRELWLVDTRGREVRFSIHSLHDRSYRAVAPDAQGRLHSPLLARSFRLLRHRERFSTWRYELEHGVS
ncbi:MAG TPA: Uma2 family endonuclease [Thermoanaerobaculia bacterium]|nr:Uma2 family endonuclease [Thermoanaerobaculia bacterium]